MLAVTPQHTVDGFTDRFSGFRFDFSNQIKPTFALNQADNRARALLAYDRIEFPVTKSFSSVDDFRTFFNAKHIVDKLPHNFKNIGLIKFLFPNARIISVRRDPRDIAISNYFTDYQAKHGGMGFAYNLT